MKKQPTKASYYIIVTFLLALSVIVSSCLPASPAQVQAALEQTQAASANTPTLQPHEVIETAIQLTFVAQTLTAQPPAATSTLPVPTNTKVVVAYSPTPGAKATATVVVASDAITVYNQVVVLCQGGAPYVTVGMVTVPCTGKVLPPPTSNDEIVNASADEPDVSGMDSSCPSNGEMFADHDWGKNGVKAVKDGINVEWEGCGKWQVQAVGIGTFRLHLVIGYQYTVTKANGVVAVYYGDGSWLNVWLDHPLSARYKSRSGVGARCAHSDDPRVQLRLSMDLATGQ